MAAAAAAAAAAGSWQDAKAAGNAAYTAGRTADAVAQYTAALQAPELPPADRATILCNRAQCFLKLADNQRAAEDCTACLTLSPDNVKALFRRCVLRRARARDGLECGTPLPRSRAPARQAHAHAP